MKLGKDGLPTVDQIVFKASENPQETHRATAVTFTKRPVAHKQRVFRKMILAKRRGEAV